MFDPEWPNGHVLVCKNWGVIDKIQVSINKKDYYGGPIWEFKLTSKIITTLKGIQPRTAERGIFWFEPNEAVPGWPTLKVENAAPLVLEEGG